MPDARSDGAGVAGKEGNEPPTMGGRNGRVQEGMNRRYGKKQRDQRLSECKGQRFLPNIKEPGLLQS